MKKPRSWFVSTNTALIQVKTKKQATQIAYLCDGIIHRECECGCGKPASKPVRS